jgi:hypothetical protein
MEECIFNDADPDPEVNLCDVYEDALDREHNWELYVEMGETVKNAEPELHISDGSYSAKCKESRKSNEEDDSVLRVATSLFGSSILNCPNPGAFVQDEVDSKDEVDPKDPEDREDDPEDPENEEHIPKIIFIVPYRDREKHHQLFSSHMKSYLDNHYSISDGMESRIAAVSTNAQQNNDTPTSKTHSPAKRMRGDLSDSTSLCLENHSLPLHPPRTGIAQDQPNIDDLSMNDVANLAAFSHETSSFRLRKPYKKPYKILYIHQTDTRGFNRGAMKNIGYCVVRDLYPNDYKNITLVFNDIDTMPSHNITLHYETQPGTIKHFYGFNHTLGGIVSVNAYDFEQLNGFPNFWAWGYEDNLFQIRAENAKIQIDRSVFYKIQDPKIIHLVDTPIREVNRVEFDRFLNQTSEGISSLHELTYKINDDNGFVDVITFETEIKEKLEARSNYDLRNGPAPFKPTPKQPRRPQMKMIF